IEQEIETRYRPVPSMENVMNIVSTNFGRVFHRQILWLESLNQLLHTGNESTNDEETKKSPEVDTIDIPLKVTLELRENHRKPGGVHGDFQQGGLAESDEIFLA